MGRIRERLTYANVVSTIALFLVLTGGMAMAAKRLGTNRIKPKAIKTKLLAPRAVKSGKIAPRAVKRRHIALNAVNGARIAPDSIDGTKVRDKSLTPADIFGGASVVATAGGGPVTDTSTDANATSIPLNGETSWTQGPSENNLFLVRIEATLAAGGMAQCELATIFRVNGEPVGTFVTEGFDTEPTQITNEVQLEGARVSTGFPRLNALTVQSSELSSSCATKRIDALRVVVLGVG